MDQIFRGAAVSRWVGSPCAGVHPGRTTDTHVSTPRFSTLRWYPPRREALMRIL